MSEKFGEKPLHPFLAAVRRNNLLEVQRLIKEGEDLNLEKRFGWQNLTEMHGNLLIGELLTLNPDELMAKDYSVVKALLVGIIKQNSGQLYTSEIAYMLGIHTADCNKNQPMRFCRYVLMQLKKDGKIESELRSGKRRGNQSGNNRYWFIQ